MAQTAPRDLSCKILKVVSCTDHKRSSNSEKCTNNLICLNITSLKISDIQKYNFIFITHLPAPTSLSDFCRTKDNHEIFPIDSRADSQHTTNLILLKYGTLTHYSSGIEKK
jgi:hypothetical protein